MLGAAAPSRDAWAFDSFEGLPAPGDNDLNAAPEWEGEMVGSEQMLRTGFERYAGRPERLRIVRGWFEETFPTVLDEIDKVAVLHIDADWYDPVMLALETFYPRMDSGAVVLVDDMNGWEGARIATEEFRDRHRITAPIEMSHFWTKP